MPEEQQRRPAALEGCCPFAVQVPFLKGMGFDPILMGCKRQQFIYIAPGGNRITHSLICGGPRLYRELFKTCLIYLSSPEEARGHESAKEQA